MENGREDQNPWTKWYWQDWEADVGLQLCSLAAQGLWMHMLSVMARSKNKGFLLDGGKQMESKTLAKKARSTLEEIEPLLEELNDHSVYSLTSKGIIYNRRMVREAKLSLVRSEAGKLGGRPKKQNKSKIKPNPYQDVKARSASASASASASDISLRNKKDKPKIILVLNEEPKRWEGITDELKAFWAKTYPGCDIDQVLQEMIAYWDAQPRSHLKLNWKRTIVNRLKWLQDHGGTRREMPRRALPGSQPPGTWLKMMKEKEAKEKKK